MADDGVGAQGEKAWSPAAVSQGFGLFSIRERIIYFGGRLDIDSRPGEGTRVTLTLPMDYQKKSRRARRMPDLAPVGELTATSV